MAKSLQEIQDMLTDKWSNNACRGYIINLRIRVSFYSVFNLPERSVRASGQLVPGRLRLSYTISFFRLFRYTLEIIF